MRARPAELALVLVATVALVALPFSAATLAGESVAQEAPSDAAATTATATASASSKTTATTTAASDDGPPESARLVARYPAANGSMVERTVLMPAGVARVDPPVNDSRTEGWRVAMTLTPSAADRFADALVDAGFTEDDAPACPTTDARNDAGYCLLVLVDGEVTSAFEIGPRFGAALESGTFAADPRFVIAAEDHDEARDIWRGFLEADRDTTTTPGTTTATTNASATTGTDDATGADPTDTAATPATEATTTTATTGASTSKTGTAALPTPGFDGVAVLGVALVAALVAVARRGEDA